MISIILIITAIASEYALFELSSDTSKISSKEYHTLQALNEQKLNRSVHLGVESIYGEERLENNLFASKIIVQNGTISHAQFLENRPNEKARKDNEIAKKILKSSLYILNSECLPNKVSPISCESYLSKTPLPDSELKIECQKIINSSRTGHHAFRRLLPANYKDGFYSMFSSSERPKPREVSSLALHNHKLSLENGLEQNKNLAIIQWAQFIEHDLSKSVVTSMKNGAPIECCNQNFNRLTPRYIHPACAPLEGAAPKNAFDRVSCLNYVRSALAVNTNCNFGSAELLNQATGYLDLSQLYGFTRKSQKNMRTLENGKLKFSESSEQGRVLLPLADNKEKFCALNENSVKSCFMAGDTRVNSNPYTIILYTIFLRSHNQIANKLKLRNPSWNDEELFQEARRTNIEIYRSLVFKEWLPIVIGKENADKLNSDALNNMLHENEYHITNEFGVAAIHFYYSMMPNILRHRKHQENDKLDSPDIVSNDLDSETIFTLKNEFYKSDVFSSPRELDNALEAILNQNALKMDSIYADSLIKNYLRTNTSDKKISGSDVLAWDIQRGRDHGLQGYVRYLQMCEGTPIGSWEDLEKYIKIEDIRKLKSVYKNVEDIDLIIGGISEIPANGSTVGPTFTCIIAEQFSKIRHWHYNFEINHQSKENSFTWKSWSASKLICDTTDIKSVPKNIFLTPSKTNPMIACTEL